MQEVIPIVRLSDLKSMIPVRSLGIKKIFIRVQDVLNQKGLPNKLYYKIKRMGGAHKFLDFNGKITLSFIMKDDLLDRLSVPVCCDLLEGLNPDNYTSIDCESYEKEMSRSKKQILSVCSKTIELMILCPEYEVIGQVKGCNRNQVLWHYNFLRKLGIKTFLLHAADFLRNGDNRQIKTLKSYASLIKKEDNKLILQGFGSQKRLEEFSFIDAGATYSHIINARNGKIFRGRRRKPYYNMNIEEASTHNLKQMLINLKGSKSQTKLKLGGQKWVAELELAELVTEK